MNNPLLGCISLPLVPGRKEPSDKSEQVTQLLFGESYTVLEMQKKWCLVRNDADGYECWIDRKQHTEVSAPPSLKRTTSQPLTMVKAGKYELLIPAGAKVSEEIFSIGNEKFELTDRLPEKPTRLAEFAQEFFGAPYLWGGKSIMGMDCSGFVQVVYSCCGIQLPRDAYQQAETGQTVDFVETAEPGDLAYFDNEEGRITHVGILLDGEHIIHASGSVRIDSIDHVGIFDKNTKTYSHQLRIVKRVFS
jgi:cell wall-associated NlpC family hydrolase